MTMTVVRDCPEAKWLPSRHRSALARLIALANLRFRQPPSLGEIEHLILAIDRDQSALENHSVAIWTTATTSAYLAVLMPIHLGLALPIAILIAPLVLQIPLFVMEPVVMRPWRRMTRSTKQNNVTIHYCLLMTLLLMASFYFATASSWVRFVAWFFFAVMIVNAMAAAILWLQRGSVRALEQRCAN